MSTNLGYDTGGSTAEVFFELLTPIPGEKVTIEPSGADGGAFIVYMLYGSGPPIIDNLDGTYSFLFTTGLETVHIGIKYNTWSDEYVNGLMPYTCEKSPATPITGSILIQAGTLPS